MNEQNQVSKGVAFLVLTFFALCVFPSHVSAGNLPFHVSIEPSSRQVDKRLTYFDLRHEPGVEETLTFSVTNRTKQTQQVALACYPATTASSGTIVYEKSQSKGSPPAPYDLSKFIALTSQQIELSPLEKKQVTVQLHHPDRDFKGVLLAGVRFTSITGQAQAKKPKTTDQMTITQHFSLVKGIVLHGATTYDQAALHFNKPRYQAQRPVSYLELPFTNPQAYPIKDLRLTVDVEKYQSQQTVGHKQFENISIAPNTTFRLPLELPDIKLAKGTYQVRIHAESQGQKWQFTSSFKVIQPLEKVRKANSASPDRPVSLFGPLIKLALASLALGLMFVVWRANFSKNEQKNNKTV